MGKFSRGNSSFRPRRGGGGYGGRGGRGGGPRFNNYRNKGKGNNNTPGGGAQGVQLETQDGTNASERLEDSLSRDRLDQKLGYGRFESGGKVKEKVGWLVDIQPTLIPAPSQTSLFGAPDTNSSSNGGPSNSGPNGDGGPGPSLSGNDAARAGIDLYFIQDDGATFKSTLPYDPYFLVACKRGTESIVEEWLMKKYEQHILRITRIRKTDLKSPNHLLLPPQPFLQLSFPTVHSLLQVRRDLLPLSQQNRQRLDKVDAYAEVIDSNNNNNMGGGGSGFDGGDPMVGVEIEDGFGGGGGGGFMDQFGDGVGGGGGVNNKEKVMDAKDCIIELREYDVIYYLRVAIDLNIRVGLWYTVSFDSSTKTTTGIHTTFSDTPSSLTAQSSISSSDPTIPKIKLIKERVERAEPVVLAFDIETTKAPLKFPDVETDRVMMISYMVDGQGYLITNREIVSEDIEDFEYTPKPDFEGPFEIFNEPDEASLLRRFFLEFRTLHPNVIATYNGDSFDFPFVCRRAQIHGMDMLDEMGFFKDNEDEFKSRGCIHMDCFRWVKRDSYLPQGSQGLKAVTTAKLGYDPIELDPELMTPYALEQPQTLARYSVSDAVATYYLYMKYVHPFIFSLCNIIPLKPDEVLRKGSGTLCETLLMVESYKAEVVMPNRHVESTSNMFEGHLLESETYVGGHVEALEAGVFRSDIPADFRLVPAACQVLIDEVDDALQFAIVDEAKLNFESVENYDKVKAEIVSSLEELRDNPLRADKPLIYHLDVAAMYPNIMLSNRLQPDSVVTEATCAACDYNRPGKKCDRRMEWAWRGEFFPAKLDEFKMVRNALEQEMFPPKFPGPGKPQRRFVDLSPTEQTSLLHKRLGDYSSKVYKKRHDNRIQVREAIICQREDSFYIDTVRDFRDRRYVYKGEHKKWKKNLDNATAKGGSIDEVVEAKKMIVLFDSLQLAHKCILNSFYGYVMRKGARWHSMEMAGITCLTGARIIQMARQLVEQIGRPLELDTDGIWCMLPGTFPDKFTITLAGGKKLPISYPCTMLNHRVHKQYTNHQYHKLSDPQRGTYDVSSENSIFFELDGPYRAMILPSSKEEDKLLKKRYAVFDEDGSLAELKGFEVKRRGELQLIKIFQTQIFEKFLLGTTLKECYTAVASVANQWLDVLTTKAASLHDDELVDLIAENRSMSKTLAEYAGQKSTSISTAKRLAEFLGDQMVKDKGLACRFVISAKPLGAPVTERAVPVAIFSAEFSVRKHFLRKWLKDTGLVDFDLRAILDWDYYIERLGSVVQKLITIPAAMQKVPNPVPRIRHPDWLLRRVASQDDRFRQHKLTDMFAKQRQLAIERAEQNDGEPLEQEVAVTVNRPEENQVREPEPEPAPAPNIGKDYRGWIKHMKPLWRKQVAARAALKVGKGRRPQGRLTNMLFQRSDFLTSKAWEIVQILPSERAPGEFQMWLLINDTLQPLKLRVERQFFVNFKHIPSDTVWPQACSHTSLSRTLPRSQKMLDLVQVTLPESAYVAQEADFSELLNRPEVDAVYEMQVPLMTRALLKLGSSCELSVESESSLSRGLSTGFDLADLVRAGATLSKKKYLGLGTSLRYAWLYHAFNNRDLHVFALIIPHAQTAKIFIVEPRKNKSLPNLAKYHAERLASKPKTKDGAFEYPEILNFISEAFSRESDVVGAITKEMTRLSAAKAGPTILVVHSTKPRSHYEGIGHDHPIIMCPASKAENVFGLQWQAETTRRMVDHYLNLSRWLRDYIEIAGRFNVPVGNLEQDWPSFVADIEFARKVSLSDHLLWWSPTSRPDLGGREWDTNSSQLLDDLNPPEVSRPGCYSNAVVEVELLDLAVDALIQSSVVYDLESSDGPSSFGFDTATHTLDEYAKGTANAAVSLGDAIVPGHMLSLLKSLVKEWWSEGARSHGWIARHLISNVLRWISSPSSRMFDPALYRFVFGLMRKTFSQLLAEFRRLGSEVVYADFNRLWLVTNKPTAETAYAYGTYIVTAVNDRELFKYVNLQVVRFWNQLLWMDSANFAGAVSRIADGEDAGDDQDHPLSNKPRQTRIEGRWNIATFLPDAVRPSFIKLVGEFIHQMHRLKIETVGEYRTPFRVVENASQTHPDPTKKQLVDRAKEFVSTVLTKHLLERVDSLSRDYDDSADSPEARETFQFPPHPGRHLLLKKPVLELIKFFCTAIGLAKDLSVEVQILRKNALDFIGVREFSPEATFRNPCLPFKGPTMICHYCNVSRPLDLCRDSHLVSHGRAESGKPPPTSVWSCLNCSTPYDLHFIETSLIDSVMRLVSGYQQFDLRCSRCKQMKTGSLNLHCQCSGTFLVDGGAGTVGKAGLVAKLKVAQSVSIWYGFKMFEDVISEVLENTRQ